MPDRSAEGEENRSGSILLVEDDDALRETLLESLRGEGYAIVEARTGSEARAVLRGDSGLALIITDIRVPEVEGFELVQEARETRPSVPILAMTGGDSQRTEALRSDAYLSTARRLGATRTLSKPFRLDEFIATVRDLLDG